MAGDPGVGPGVMAPVAQSLRTKVPVPLLTQSALCKPCGQHEKTQEGRIPPNDSVDARRGMAKFGWDRPERIQRGQA